MLIVAPALDPAAGRDDARMVISNGDGSGGEACSVRLVHFICRQLVLNETQCYCSRSPPVSTQSPFNRLISWLYWDQIFQCIEFQFSPSIYATWLTENISIEVIYVMQMYFFIRGYGFTL